MFRAVCVRRPGRHASARRAPDGATSMPGAAGVRVGGARRGRRDDAGQLGDGEPRAAGGDDRRPGGATAPVTPMRGAGCGGKTALAGDDHRFPRLWRCICPCFSAGALVSRRMRMPWPGAGCADRRRRACGVRRRVASTPRTGSHIRSPPPAAHAAPSRAAARCPAAAASPRPPCAEHHRRPGHRPAHLAVGPGPAPRVRVRKATDTASRKAYPSIKPRSGWTDERAFRCGGQSLRVSVHDFLYGLVPCIPGNVKGNEQ